MEVKAGNKIPAVYYNIRAVEKSTQTTDDFLHLAALARLLLLFESPIIALHQFIQG